MHCEQFARLICAGALVIFVGSACATPTAREQVPAPKGADCGIAPAPIARQESLVVALPPVRVGGVGSPALIDAQRFEAELTRETLIRVDCDGGILPGLAASWVIDSATDRWTFTLDQSANLPNGDQITSREVFAAWHSANLLDAGLGAIRDSLVALDAQRVRVVLPGGDARVLASPELAVLEHRPLPVDDAVAENGPRLTGIVSPNAVRVGGATVIFGSIDAESDVRDFIDRGVDLIITEDPSAARYLSARDGFVAHNLQPQRTYAIALSTMEPLDGTAPRDLVDLREALASNVIGLPARPASGLPWWERSSECTVPMHESPSARGTILPRIAYRSDDPIARSIAERLVSLESRGDTVVRQLVGGSSADRLVVEALAPGEYVRALRERTRSAYIVPVPARPLATCRELALLAAAMPWATDGGTLTPGALVPLIQPVALAIVRRAVVGLAASWDGTPIVIMTDARTGAQ